MDGWIIKPIDLHCLRFISMWIHIHITCECFLLISKNTNKVSLWQSNRYICAIQFPWFAVSWLLFFSSTSCLFSFMSVSDTTLLHWPFPWLFWCPLQYWLWNVASLRFNKCFTRAPGPDRKQRSKSRSSVKCTRSALLCFTMSSSRTSPCKSDHQQNKTINILPPPLTLPYLSPEKKNQLF